MSLEESLKNIQQSAETQPETPVEPKPKKRGRKSGSKMVGGKVIQPNQQEPVKEVSTPLPDPSIAHIIKIPFDVWASSQELDSLKLDEKEALNLSAPIKQLMDYYLPQISPIGYVWVNLGIVSASIITKRMQLIADEREKREKNSTDNGSEGKRKVDASEKRVSKKE